MKAYSLEVEGPMATFYRESRLKNEVIKLSKYFSFMTVVVMSLVLASCTPNLAENQSLETAEETKAPVTESVNETELLSSPPAVQVPLASGQAVPPEGQPPLPSVQAGNTSIHVVQSSYCWDTLGCGDFVGGRAMLQGTAPTVVVPGEQITIALDYEPRPSKVYVTEIREDNAYAPVELEKGTFEAPGIKGEYYYLYEATWETEDGKYTLKQTSAVFAVEVK